MVSTTKRRAGQREITRRKIVKLQKAGLLSSKINPDARPSKFILSKFDKYKGVLSGRQAAVKISSSAKAKELRGRLGEGGQGKIVIVPREKGEKFRVVGDTIKSTRVQYGQRIEKTIGDKFTAPKAGEKIYYTIPRRKRGLGQLRRHTFASFDELLFYLSKYEIEFDDIEDYIEVERFADGSQRQIQHQREYDVARAKLIKRRNRSKKSPIKKRSKRK